MNVTIRGLEFPKEKEIPTFITLFSNGIAEVVTKRETYRTTAIEVRKCGSNNGNTKYQERGSRL